MSAFTEEQALPPLWDNGVYSPDRFYWYTNLVLQSGLIRGGKDVVSEFIAAMCAESSLDNLILGNNAKNGSPNTSVGVGWCQLDTAWHVSSLAQFHEFRESPLTVLEYVANPDNGLVVQGGRRTHFKRQLWHAWEPEKIDPVNGWSPLAAAADAYDMSV